MLDIILVRIKLKIADFGMQIKSSQQAAAPLATAVEERELFWVHKYADLLKLYELDKVSLDDLWDEDWAIIQNILFEKQAL
jgi:hypothetical protein